MPLLPFAACDVPAPQTDCEFLFDTGRLLLDIALAGLTPYLPPSEADDTFDTYVSMGPPVAEFYDALSIHLVSFGAPPARRAPASSNTGVWPVQVAEWDMRLWENVYPVPRSAGEGVIAVPPPAEYQAVNRHVYAHGTAIHNALTTAQVANTLGLPRWVDKVTIGALKPISSALGESGAVGWKIEVATEGHG